MERSLGAAGDEDREWTERGDEREEDIRLGSMEPRVGQEVPAVGRGKDDRDVERVEVYTTIEAGNANP